MKERIIKFNKILNNKSYNNTIKSISLLHQIKLHKHYLQKKINFFYFIKKIIKLFKTFFFLNPFIFLKNINTEEKKFFNRKIIIVSHFLNLNQIKNKNDLYLNRLEGILKDKNKTYLKCLINHTNNNSVDLNKLIKDKNTYILKNYLKIGEELKIFFERIFCIFNLISIALKKEINFKILINLIISLFDSETTASLKISSEIKKIIKKVKPKYIIFTYEGFSWERMLVNSTKQIDKKIKCIGYQHTVINKNYRAVFECLKGYYNPDIIWSSNSTSKKMLDKYYKNKKTKIIFSGNLKDTTLKTNLKKQNKNSFLILPEGMKNEVHVLFSFAYKCAQKFKNFKFIWRVHPVINPKLIYKNFQMNKETFPKNLILSKNKFIEDVKKTNYVIYRGSTAVLIPIISGSYPIYYDLTNDYNFDPVASFFKKKNYVRDENELLNFVKKVNFKKLHTSKNMLKKIKNNFFSKPEKNQILNSIK